MSTNNEILRAMLHDGAQWDPAYPFAPSVLLTDHLPMALQALWRLGASPDQLREFQTDYVRKLVPLAQHERVDVSGDAWQQWLGDWRIYRPLRNRLIADIATSGRAVVLREWLPHLIVCAAIDALHPLIRLGYGIEQEVDEEIAAGLAYWAAEHRPGVALAGRNDVAITGGAAELFARLRTTTELAGQRFSHRAFNERLQTVCAVPTFAQVTGWRNDDVGLTELAREAARIYLATDDFFALHMVTGAHALRMLVPYVDAQVLLDRGWQALAATYLIIGAPDYVFSERDVAVPGDARLVEAGLRAKKDPEHVIKLAHSAREELRAGNAPEHAMILAGIVRR